MEYSENFKKVIKKAKEYSNGLIEPPHLLFGIISTNDCNGYKILSNIIDIDDAKKKMKTFLNSDPISVDTIEKKDDDLASLSTEAQNIMMQSQLEAKKFNSSIVRTEHIVLSIIRAKVIPNVTYTDAENIYNKVFNKNSNMEKDDNPTGTNVPYKKTKTPILDEFSTDLTDLAKQNKLDPVIGREKEIKRIAQVLSRRKKNNPILIGSAGVGKTAIVDGLSQAIINKETPDILHNKRILSLEMGSVVAGTKYRGEFEERMKKIVDELKQNSDIIIYIDEIHTIVGAGGSTGSLDAANILKPALSRGEISCIGSTTNEEYKKIEKDGALERRFQKIRVNEPTYNETYEILKNLKDRYENHHMVEYTDESIIACLKLSDRYISDRQFPDKAIDVMDEAGASVRINIETPVDIINKENELDEITKQKLKKVSEQDFLSAAELLKQQRSIESELEIMKNDLKNKRLSKRKKVRKEDVYEVISIMTNIPSKNITDDDTSKLVNLPFELKKKIIGQDDAVDKISMAILRNKAGLNDGKRPIGTFLLLGPTGTGKTHMVKKLAEQLFNSERDYIRIDMSEYMEKHSVSRLIGAPPGYVGHEDGGQLTDAVKNKPYSIILLDEIEKAHNDVWNVLLQVFDDGILTDSQGRTVDFKNTVIIMTSNIGSKESKLRGAGIGFNSDKQVMSKSIVEKELKKKFSPEFLNRIDEVVHFDSLSKDNIKSIIDIELDNFRNRLIDNNIDIELDETAKDFIFEKGWDEDMGARPLKRAIQKYIQDEVSIKIITKEVVNGDKIIIAKSQTEDKLEIVNITKMLIPISGDTITNMNDK